MDGMLRGMAALMVMAAVAVGGGTQTLVRFGKSVDWHGGLGRIASARLGRDGYYDVFTMRPDGGGVRSVTDGLRGCPPKHNGNPCFHPSGKWIVFTAQDPRLPEKDKAVRRVTIPGSGLGSNLYVARVDGGGSTQLTSYPLRRPFRAVIHPQFSKDGRRLAWSERVRRGDSFGGGWVIKLADLDLTPRPRLRNIKTLAPGERDCFYEVHDFSPDGKRLLFSGNLKKGQPHTGLDIYEIRLGDERLTRLTRTRTDWDEHAHYSPDGRRIAWMSSAGLDVQYGPEKGSGVTWKEHLRAELWVMAADGSGARRVTHFNARRSQTRWIVSDSSWSPDGRSVVACVARFSARRKGVELMRIEIPQ